MPGLPAGLIHPHLVTSIRHMLAFALIPTEWGYFTLAASEKGVCGTILPTRSVRQAERRARHRWPTAATQPALLRELQEQIAAYFVGATVRFDAPLDLTGQTEFRRTVLRLCAAIDYGTTKTYGQLAIEVGSPAAARAVGGAMAHNPIPLIIPCHRVLAANGRLGGFSAEGGLALKARMLQLEGVPRHRSHRR